MKEKKYIFTQNQLEGFIAYAILDCLEHPNSSPKATIKRLYKADKNRGIENESPN